MILVSELYTTATLQPWVIDQLNRRLIFSGMICQARLRSGRKAELHVITRAGFATDTAP